MIKSAMNKQGPRGFVIVIVVAVAVVITAIVAAQLTSSQKLAVASLRMEEEVQARGIAQACLEMVSAQIDNYMFDCGALPLPACSTRPPDFDALLIGVDGIANNNDDFLPGIGTRVQIPRVATDRLHQWALFDLDGGACAMRIEDNSDDARPPLPSMIDTAGEGTGTDVANRDRDLAVYVNVIGMFPRLTTSNADVYHRAHARVTLRRLIQKQNMSAPSGPGLWAGVSIDIDDDNDICELGGVAAPSVDMESSSCACGVTSCTTCTGLPPVGTTCSACTTGCTPSSSTGAIGPPPANVHWGDTAVAGTSFRANEGLGPPLRANVLTTPGTGQGVAAPPTTAYELSNAQFCGFYGDNSAEKPLFVWDRLDPDAGATLENWRDNGTWEVPSTTQHPAVAAVSGGLPVDCRTHTADIPEPCVWAPGATDASPSTITSCPTAKSACWKLIAWMELSDSYAVGLHPAAVPLRGWTDNGGDGGFHPKKSVAIPNTAPLGAAPGTASVFGNAVAGQQLLCGDPSPASNCTTCTANPVDAVGPADNNAKFVFHAHADKWHFKDGASDTFAPSPSLWVMEDLSSTDKDVDIGDAAGTAPFRATFLVDGAINVETNGAVCCATCDCTSLGVSLTLGSCLLNSTFGGVASTSLTNLVTANPALSTNTDPPTQDNRPMVPAQGGVALKARTRINANNDAVIIGDVRGGTVDFNNDPCVLGNIVAYDTAIATKCGGSGICDPSHVCFNNDPNIIGDIHSMSSISFNNDPTIWGNVIAKSSVCFNNQSRIEGLIQAGVSMELDQDSRVVNNVSSTSGAATTALNQALVTFMEGAW